MSNNNKPRLTLVLGDPCGIGPELAAKLLADAETTRLADIIAIADQQVFDEGVKIAGVSVNYRVVDDIADDDAEGIVLLSRPFFSSETSQRGKVSKQSGQYQLDCLETGLSLCQQGLAHGMCFAPLNKEAMHLAGLIHEDESGFFIDQLDHRGDFGLLNTLGNLWTSRATSHVSHRQVSELLSQESILEATRLLDGALRTSGLENPRIAVAGLNPHAGDGGMFGTEEIDIIEPAIKKAVDEGINSAGPFPPDTIFLMGRAGKYDAIVTMYHDQGQIAMKLMGFERGVTVHAGLPFPVTTSAHGSAFDIAGHGIANVSALREAFLLACSMVR
ncbi:MAG: 4-hydroxythreonine-4-phosphate dehydrogenase PdxA [Desulfofustis sp.]|nr:4-hydroxythreonine-4-phosphate dehydrogenase PdxA [Desulfofustis sp.]